MIKRFSAFCMCLISLPAFAASVELDVALSRARTACGGISDTMAEMKRMAGVNTAVTGVGTAVGVAATAVGIAKADTDKEIENLEMILVDDVLYDEMLEYVQQLEANPTLAENSEDDLEQKSKNQGNWRTGLLATNTVTNVAGAVIAGGNKVDVDLDAKIKDCVASVDALSRARMTAQIDGTGDAQQLMQSQNIIRECGEWQMADLSKIDNRARGASVASSVGAGVGLIGTIVSAAANSKDVRAGDAQKEQNLNAAANVLSGGATVASGAATVFNATQIGAIKRAAEIADKCEGVL